MALFTPKYKKEGHLTTIGRAPSVVLKQILQPSQQIMMLNMAVSEGMELTVHTLRSLMASEDSRQ